MPGPKWNNKKSTSKKRHEQAIYDFKDIKFLPIRGEEITTNFTTDGFTLKLMMGLNTLAKMPKKSEIEVNLIIIKFQG